MTERSRRITTFVFLLSIFVFLTAIIFVWSITYYRGGKATAINVSKSTIECSGYAYLLIDNSMIYENKTLRFEIEYLGEGADKFKRLTVIANNRSTRSEEIGTLLRRQPVVIKNIEINDSFLISPEGCESQNIKRCSLSTKKCIPIS